VRTFLSKRDRLTNEKKPKRKETISRSLTCTILTAVSSSAIFAFITQHTNENTNKRDKKVNTKNSLTYLHSLDRHLQLCNFHVTFTLLFAQARNHIIRHDTATAAVAVAASAAATTAAAAAATAAAIAFNARFNDVRLVSFDG
jgi:hypothetical protein